MEYLEYLPSYQARDIYLNKKIGETKNMHGKVLTRNVILQTECTNCSHTDEITIQELRDYGIKEDCDKCGFLMILSQECRIKD